VEWAFVPSRTARASSRWTLLHSILPWPKRRETVIEVSMAVHRLEERGQRRGLTTLILHSTFSVVVLRGRGSRSKFDLGLSFVFVVKRGSVDVRRGSRDESLSRNEKSVRGTVRSVGDLVAAVADVVGRIRGEKSGLDLVLVAEGRSDDLACLGRLIEFGRSREVNIIEGAVAGE